jgi:hypothetical protein
MRLAQHVISLALGKPFRYRDFSTIPYGKLRQMGLLRARLIWDQISQNLTQARQKLQWHGPQYGVYGFGALGNCFGV